MSTIYRIAGRCLAWSVVIVITGLIASASAHHGGDIRVDYTMKGAADLAALLVIFPSIRWWSE